MHCLVEREIEELCTHDPAPQFSLQVLFRWPVKFRGLKLSSEVCLRSVGLGSPGAAGRPFHWSSLGFSGFPCFLQICAPVEGFGAFQSRRWVDRKFLSPPASSAAVLRSLVTFLTGHCSILWWCCCLRLAMDKWFFVQFSTFSPSWAVLGFFFSFCGLSFSYAVCHVCVCEGGREVLGSDWG